MVLEAGYIRTHTIKSSKHLEHIYSLQKATARNLKRKLVFLCDSNADLISVSL